MPPRRNYDGMLYITADGVEYRVKDIPTMTEITTALFDTEETYPDCTVQILSNSVTGEKSIGWYENAPIDRIPVDWIESQVDKGKWRELVQRWREHVGK